MRTEVNLPPTPPPVLGGDGKNKAGGAHCVSQRSRAGHLEDKGCVFQPGKSGEPVQWQNSRRS
jgi:hypothetical protein